VRIVFHLAAVVDWGTHSREEVFSVNVGGTENVIHACLEQGVEGHVFTSSEDAIYAGRPIREVVDVTERSFGFGKLSL
jgi:nucleoside-diphosphate-sugar epimerase